MTRTLRLVLAHVLIAGCLAAPAAAQTHGVRGGANLMTFVVSPDGALGDEPGGAVGALGGVFLTLRKGDAWNIEVAGQLSRRRLTFGPHIDDRVTYLEVPAVLTIPVMKAGARRVRVLAGGSFSTVVMATENVLGQQSYSVRHAYRSTELAAVAGAQADLNARWGVDVRYLFGFTEAYAEKIDDTTTTRQRGLEITVSYRLK